MKARVAKKLHCESSTKSWRHVATLGSGIMWWRDNAAQGHDRKITAGIPLYGGFGREPMEILSC